MSIFIPLYLFVWVGESEVGEILLIVLFISYSFTLPTLGLLTSRWRAKKQYNLFVLKPNENIDPFYEYYLQMTYRICERVGMKKMPQVAVYKSEEANAFATGRSRRSSLIAFSTKLLETMSDDEIEAVIAHEVSHIMNGDMVTQTLIHSYLNLLISLILFPLTIMRWMLIFVAKHDTRWIITIYIFFESLARITAFFFANLVSKAYSRRREYQADLLAARLTSPQKMIRALRKLEEDTYFDPRYTMNAAQHFNGKQAFAALFATHPTIEKRISYIMKKELQLNTQRSTTFSWSVGSIIAALSLSLSFVVYAVDLPPSLEFKREKNVEDHPVYLLANSAKEYLVIEDINGLSKADLRLARNEIYARHGFIFGAEDLQGYFSKQSWYTPNPNYTNDLLSEIEHKNIYLIQQEESKRQ